VTFSKVVNEPYTFLLIFILQHIVILMKVVAPNEALSISPSI